MHISEPLLLNVRSQKMEELMLNIRLANVRWRLDDVLSLEKLVLHSVVFVLFELLEGLEGHYRPAEDIKKSGGLGTGVQRAPTCPLTSIGLGYARRPSRLHSQGFPCAILTTPTKSSISYNR
jgi:hypothetical protein